MSKLMTAPVGAYIISYNNKNETCLHINDLDLLY